MNRRTEVSGTTVAGETGIVGRCRCCCSVPCGHKHRRAKGLGSHAPPLLLLPGSLGKGHCHNQCVCGGAVLESCASTLLLPFKFFAGPMF